MKRAGNLSAERLMPFLSVLAAVFLLWPSDSQAFNVGDRVQCVGNLNVRSTPSTSSLPLVTTEVNGSQGTITSGPQSGSGYTWWYISWADGYSGWSVQDGLTVLQCDIIVQGTPTISPNPVTAGGSISVGYVIHNNGPGNAGTSHTKIQIKNSSNVEITAPVFSSPAVNAYASSSTQSSSVSIPAGTAAGTYTAYVVLDNYTELNEVSSGIANDLTPGVNFTVSAPVQQCDIVVQGTPTISPNPVTAGGSISVGYVIHNNGPGNAGTSHTKIQIKNSSNVEITAPVFSSPAVNAYASSSTQSSSVSIPAGTAAGTYTAYVVLDNYTELNESNTANDLTPGVIFMVNAVSTPPTVFTAGGQSSGSSSAMLWGNVNPNGAPTDAWFEWGTSAPAYGNTTPATAKGSGTDSVQHLVTIDGLSYNTTYHFRVVARNSAGTSYGGDKSFTMPAPPVQSPSVQTLAASDVSRTWASLQGLVNPNGSPCSIWFEWGVTTSYGNRTSGYSYGGSGSSDLSASEMLTGLAEGQVYHFRVCASNSAGIVYGTDKSFQTETGPQITVSSPNGGESIQAGTALSIGWTVGGNTSSINNFRVDYSLTAGAQWSSLAYCSASARSVTWVIPADTVSTQAQLRVRACDSTGNIVASDECDNKFAIFSGTSHPLAVPDSNENAPAPGTPVSFDGWKSQPSSGHTIVSYAWDFGDGGTATGVTAQHTYTTLGQRTVTLMVTDSAGLSDTKSMTVTVTGQALGTPPTVSMSLDPVNLATGNFIYDHTDLVIPGIGFPFEFKRTYNSKDSRFTGPPLGSRWTHSYNIQLSVATGVVSIVFGDGRSETYTNSAGVYFAETGIYNTLSTNASGSYVLTTKEQLHYNFDALGRLASITDKNSNTLSLAYDGAGALTAVTNSAGRVITFMNDSSHRITAMIDPLGRTNSFEYSEQGDLISAADPRGGVTRYGYDGEHQMTNAVDPNGNEFVRNVYNNNRVVEAQQDALGGLTTFTYDFVTRITVVSNALGDRAIHKHDDNLRVVEITDEAGNTQAFEYDEFNNRTKVVDKNGRSTSYTYDAKGNVTSKTDPLLNLTTISYDALNNPTSRVDALMGRTSFTYDGNGNLVTAVNPLGYTNSISYESRGLPQIIRDANGNSVSNTYDSAGNLVATVDALNYVRSYSYDAAGRKVSEVNPNSATNRFVYDPNNNLIAAIDPLGFTNSFAYDANNNQVLIRDALGFETVKTFDAKDRLIAVSNALSGVSSNVYDALDRRIATVDPLGSTTRLAYDPVGNLVAVTNALGAVTRYTCDPNGNQLAVINALGQATTNEYDELNRLVSVTDPLGNTVRYDYDDLGRRTRITDANSQITRFQYDALGQLTNVIDAATGTVSFVYDKVGNRTAMKEPNGHITVYLYDELNRLVEKQEPIGTYKYSYDGAGNRVETVDALNRTNSYVYDANNRLLGIVYPTGAPVTFSYDANGNRTNMTDSLGTTTYQYDSLNRLTNCTDSAGMSVGYAYDIRGNRESMTYPGDKVVSYTFDALNRMTSVRDWLGGVTTNTYDAAGNLVLTVNPNGTTSRYGFDDAGRLTSLTNALADSTVISGYALTLDGVGNHRASAQTEPLEPVVPEQTVNYAYDQDNRLTNAAGSAFSYDLNGNMTARGSDTFTYDYENRLTSAVVGGTNYLYRYDGLGNRLSAVRGGVTNRYVLDVNGSLAHVLAEADGNGTVTAYYVYGRGLISRITADGTASYYHYDVRGSTVALTDSAGTITDKYTYDPFGVLANRAGDSENPFKYVGRYGIMDEGNGLAYIRARYYSPELGLFVTKDPVTGKDGDSQSLNRYIYALNNPVRLIDVSGFSSRDVWQTGVEQFREGVVDNVFALVSGASGAVSGPAGWISGFISTLDGLNDGSKLGVAGGMNMLNAALGLGKSTVSPDEVRGLFDSWLDNDWVRGIRDVNQVYSLLTVPSDVGNAANSLRLLANYSDVFSESILVIKTIKAASSLRSISQAPSDTETLINNVKHWYSYFRTQPVSANTPLLPEIIEVKSCMAPEIKTK